MYFTIRFIKHLIKVFVIFFTIVALIYASYSFYLKKIKYKNTKIVVITEGFGNQLYQYAFAYVLGKRTGQKILYYDDIIDNDERVWVRHFLQYFDTKIEFVKINKIDRFFLRRRFFKLCIPQKNKRKCELKTINVNTLFLNDYIKEDKNHKFAIYQLTFLDPEYFEGYEEGLRNIFLNLSPEHQHELDEKNKAMIKEMQSHKNSVAINIRLGDFLYHPALNVCNFNYYKKAMKIFENMEDVHYYIFSDDIEAAKKYFKTNKPHTYVDVNPLGKPYLNLILSASAKHNIISNSTFAMWAAILNRNPNKIVVCPSEYIRVGKDNPMLEPSKHVWHRDWIKIDTSIDKPIDANEIDTKFNKIAESFKTNAIKKKPIAK